MDTKELSLNIRWELLQSLYEDLVLSDEEIADIVNGEMDRMDENLVIDMITMICEKSQEDEPGEFKKASPIAKIVFTGKEMYKYGLLSAIICINDSIREYFRQHGYESEAV